MNTDPQKQLVALEKELTETFEHFKHIYAETSDPKKHLSNQQVYDLIADEYAHYSEHIETIKKRALTLLQEIEEHKDNESSRLLLERLNLQIKKSNKI